MFRRRESQNPPRIVATRARIGGHSRLNGKPRKRKGAAASVVWDDSAWRYETSVKTSLRPSARTLAANAECTRVAWIAPVTGPAPPTGSNRSASRSRLSKRATSLVSVPQFQLPCALALACNDFATVNPVASLANLHMPSILEDSASWALEGGMVNLTRAGVSTT